MNRGGETRTLRAQIAAPQEHAPGQGQAIPQLAGLQVVEIERGSPLYQRIQGLIVAAVERNSRAWQYGFRPGDIVYAVNGKRVLLSFPLFYLTPASATAVRACGSTLIAFMFVKSIIRPSSQTP